MKKRICILTVAVLLCNVMTGCGFSREKKIEKLLEEKYGEQFVVQKVWKQADGVTPFSGDYYAYCYPEGDRELLFRIRVDDFDTKDFHDTYPHSLVAEELQEQMQEKLDEYFPECFVYPYVSGDSVIYLSRKEVTIEGFVERAERPSANYKIAVNQSHLQSDDYGVECDFLFECLAEMNQESGIDGTLGVFFLPEDIYRQYYNHFQEELWYADTNPEFVDDYPHIGMGFLIKDGSKNLLVHGKSGSLTSTDLSREEYIKLREEAN